MRKVLIVGGTSAIAQETAKMFATDGASLCLVGRNQEKLSAVASDLRIRGDNRVETYLMDATRLECHEELLTKVIDTLGGLDVALIAHGALPSQEAAERSAEEMVAAFMTNSLSVMAMVTVLANYMERQGQGSIGVITSVAGDRGKRSNYVYGAAKGAVDIYLQGLRNRLFKAGVSVVTIKLGFVDTPMTAHLPKNILFASSRAAGKGVYKAMIKGKDIVYIPWFWRWIMLVIKLIPETLFKRMRL